MSRNDYLRYSFSIATMVQYKYFYRTYISNSFTNFLRQKSSVMQ